MSPVAAAFDRTYDVLISYRHRDSVFAAELARRLREDHGLRVFLDAKAHEPGYDWRTFWTEALRTIPEPELDPGVGPGVLVLATQALLEARDEDVVVQEIGAALGVASATGRTVPIHVLRFDVAGYEELKRRVHRKLGWDAASNHEVRGLEGLPVGEPDRLTAQEWARIGVAAARVARVALLRRLEELREEALIWGRRVLEGCLTRVDFGGASGALRAAGDRIREDARESRRQQVALVGAGGFGKSVTLAHLLEQRCGDRLSRLFPVLLAAEEVDHGVQAVRRKLGLGSSDEAEPLSELEALSSYGRVVFVTDSLERADSVSRAAASLAQLRDAGGLWITTRPAAWEEANRTLQFDAADVFLAAELDTEYVAKELGKDGKFVRDRPYLQQALYLDLAAYMLGSADVPGAGREKMLSTSTALLDAFRGWALTVDDSAAEREVLANSVAQLVQRLARRQTERLAFEIERDALLAPDERVDAAFDEALEHLIRTRPFLVEDRRPGGSSTRSVLRLRHDVIDAHNVVRVAQGTPEERARLIEAQDRGFGQIVCELLAQVAIDEQDDSVLRELFGAFLRACDNKAPMRPDSPWNARAWAGTYLVQRKLSAFLPWIRSALGGRQLGFVEPAQEGEAISSLEPPQLTREALSSVASAFLGAGALAIPDPDGAWLRLVGAAARNAERKARLIEALARFDDGRDGAVEALNSFARDAELLRRDPGLMAYLATGLRDLARTTSSESSKATALETALRLVEAASALVDQPNGIDRPTLRGLIESRREIAREAGAPPGDAPPWTTEEIVQGLALHAFERPADLSDWRVFWKYCELLRTHAGAVPGARLEECMLALGRGLWHDANPCRVRALQALAGIDHPSARAFLLHALSTQSNDAVEEAALNGVCRQRAKLDERPPSRAAFDAALALAACRRAERFGGSRMEQIGELLGARGIPGPADAARLLVSHGALELRRWPHTVRLAPREGTPPEFAGAERLVQRIRPPDPGADQEEKIRFLLPEPGADSSLFHAPSSWRWARPFHCAAFTAVQPVAHQPRSHFRGKPEEAGAYDRALERHVEGIALVHGGLEALLSGAELLPGLGVVHALIVTADGQVVETRRALDADYYPGAWSVSFEEQIQGEDLQDENPILACLRRGIREEFGLEVARDQVEARLVSLFLEWPILNLGAAVVATTTVAGEHWMSTPGDGELADRRVVPIQHRIASLGGTPWGGVHLGGEDDWHPTSALRVALLRSTHERGSEASEPVPAASRPEAE